ncbi:hypothetical protein [Maricaulis maris]|uniref:hypothetical protein n=1 Tax=Maricaulis maris TaxID=74318 RepID=UPI003B8AFE6D
MARQDFDIGKGIFWFFIRFGEKPGGAIWLITVQALCAMALLALSVMVMGPAYLNLFQLIEADAARNLSDAEELQLVFDFLLPLLSYGFMIIPIGLLFAVMFQAAWLRFLTKGEIKPVIPLRLGADEIRLIGVNLLYIVIVIAGYFGVAAVLGVFGVGAAFVFHGGGDSAAMGIGAGLLITLAVLGVLAGLIMLAIRLASAPALTILDGRLRFFESWEATNGVFWHMLLAYVVVWALLAIGGSILSGIVQLAVLAAFLPTIIEFVEIAEQGQHVDPDVALATVQAWISEPLTVVSLLIGFGVLYVVQVLFEAVWHSVGAYNAVRARSGGEGEASDVPTLAADHPMGASPSEG